MYEHIFKTPQLSQGWYYLPSKKSFHYFTSISRYQIWT